MSDYIRGGFFLLLIFLLQGCAELGYYYQSAKGHMSLMTSMDSIDDLLKEGELSEQRQKQLQQVVAIRRYATENLGLPDNDSYTSYVELGRKYAVWSVVATPPYSMKPKEWCFPVVGCVTYKGYFAEADADALGEELRKQGLDVYVGGVQAYSTLGWFDDPIVSSMLDRGDILLAEIIFHELAHQKLYFKDDTDFNEAFATVVGEYGVRQWLKETNEPALERYEKWLGQKDAFVRLLRETSDDLKVAFARSNDPELLAREKSKIYDQLRENYQMLKQRSGGKLAYDKWFEKPVNNARLATVSVYRDLIPEFVRWLERCDGDFDRFYGAMLSFKDMAHDDRLDALKGQATCS